MAILTVRIKNFEDYKGRTDVRHNSWFRCSNRLLEDPDFFDFSHAEILVWIYILSLASQKNSDTVLLNFDHADRVCRLPRKAIEDAVKKLEGKQLDPVDVTPTIRGRYADVTRTCATDRQTDRQDNVGPDGPGLPSLANLWNEKVKSLPAVKKWNDAREKLRVKFLKKFSEVEWSEICDKVESSDFLSGRNGKWTHCGFDWAIKTPNATKVIEGNYSAKDGGDSFSGVAS